MTAEQLIYLAYAGPGAREGEYLLNDSLGGPSDDKKIRGGPAWVHSYRDKFAIEATAPAGVSDRTILMGAMLRTLLEERFQLKAHRESEDVPMYALTAARSGFKLKPMKEGDCDIRLEFHPDESTPGIKWPAHCDVDTSVPPAASIFTALEQQLGLKLERTKGPRGFIVIDRIEKPAPNEPDAVEPPARAKGAGAGQ